VLFTKGAELVVGLTEMEGGTLTVPAVESIPFDPLSVTHETPIEKYHRLFMIFLVGDLSLWYVLHYIHILESILEKECVIQNQLTY